MYTYIHTYIHINRLWRKDDVGKGMLSDCREKMASVSDMYDVSWEGKLKRRKAQDIHNELELQ